MSHHHLSNTNVLVTAHSSSNRCQSLFERAKREDSSKKIAPTCPIATSLTRVLKSSRLIVSSPDCARSPSRILARKFDCENKGPRAADRNLPAFLPAKFSPAFVAKTELLVSVLMA